MSHSPAFSRSSRAALTLAMCTAAIMTLTSVATADNKAAWSNVDRGKDHAANQQGRNHRLGGPRPEADDDQPTRPVPEPGTMSLVAMGVIAVAAGARRIRSH